MRLRFLVLILAPASLAAVAGLDMGCMQSCQQSGSLMGVLQNACSY